MKYSDVDTIAAISTGMGSAGIGIVRLSGERSAQIADKIFKGVSGVPLTRAQNQKLYYGHIIDPQTGQTVDEVLVAYMRGPNSYTAEDVVEINCHGGIVPTGKILDLVINGGARHAQPGEFTKRAFLNGRIDLTQAESVMDVIGAKSEKALQLSVEQLNGSLKKRLKKIDDVLIDVLVLIESNLDYPEYDIEELTKEKVLAHIDEALELIENLIENGKNSAVFRNGIKTVILGKPNVGKSSLLNLLTDNERAIVTEIPGTTRDIIEESIIIDSVPFILTDTAGIRQTENVVEQIGVERSLEYASHADLILFLKESGQKLSEDERQIIDGLDPDKTIFVSNKSDLSLEELENWHKISVKNESGIKELKKQMVDLVMQGQVEASQSSVLLNERQMSLLRQTRDILKHAREGVLIDLPEEIYSIEINEALENLRAITGESIGTDVIDTIFERFCIGK